MSGPIELALVDWRARLLAQVQFRADPRPVPKLGLFEIDHKSAATRFDIRSQLGGHLHGDDPPKG